ncbi:hypothetical protein DFJ43DRAFT_1152475 [Lentinula guzmanii]|uniref:Uncharacterized protein n=1 Tax=Lentinula guzmanii TaxID=2804957 RepID=A0AA38JDM2_9AGAR|nr:hypothetical protein DFJ43DRAFT_1152475 [Lentinula guzmanii]
MNVDADHGRLLAEGLNTGPALRKVSSNSSISSQASGASLNRRPRTRGRSRTITSNSNTKPITANTDNHDELVHNNTRPVAADTSRAEEANMDEPIRMTKAAKQASQLAAITTRPPPSAFSRVPLSQIDSGEGAGVNVRDSMITQESEQTNNSTFYPLSSLSSATASPRSPTYSERSMQIEDFKSFDDDDVSYRLRLLVNNNYFLPPAHSKPLPTQMTPTTNPNASKKPTAPTFLDYFRIGRSKSKPPTPTSESGTGQALTPALRTTSDATAVSGLPMQMQTAASTSSAPPRTSNSARPADRSGRVVVVREKMADLASAAKQAELDMKVRSLQRDSRRDQVVNLPSIDDVIDPTDAVDLPLPSSAYPFAVQTSNLHGLGVNESVGAAALASRLPPPRDRSPALSSMGPDDDDDDWKRALLKAAVGHSFDNLNVAAEGALARSPRSPSSSIISSLPPVSATTSPVPAISNSVAAGRINKKIISSPIHLDTTLTKSPSIHSASYIQTNTFTNHPRPRGWSSPASPTSPSAAPSPIPIRTETPLTLVPLMPPPRSSRSPKSPKREIINLVYSISQTDLTETAGNGLAAVAALSSQAETGASTSHAYTMTPPPGHWRSGAIGMAPRESSESSQSSFKPRDSSDRETNSSSTSQSKRTGGSGADEGGYVETPDSSSVYSTTTGDLPDEASFPRNNSSMSTVTSTAQSPTTSAFQDALSQNPSELAIDGVREARPSQTDLTQSTTNVITTTPPTPSLVVPIIETPAPSALVSSSTEASASPNPPAPESPGTSTASSMPLPSITPATLVAAPIRTASLHYRDLRNRHFSAIVQNNPFLPPHSSHALSAYPTNMPPPPTLAHRSASDHGHGSTFIPPSPASRKRPPTAPAAPELAPRIELIEILAPEPTTPPFPSFTTLPSLTSLPSPSHTLQSSSSSPPSQPSLIERRHHGGENPLRGSLHIPTSIIPPAIHSAPPPSSFPSVPGPSSMIMNSPPSSSMSFFDTIQSQPNAMDFLDESSDEDADEDESESGDDDSASEDEEGTVDNKNHDKDDDDFRTAEGAAEGESPEKGGEVSVAHPTLSSLSAYSTPSARRPSTSRSSHSNRSARSTRTPLMRLGNHSTPYVSHTSLHAYADNTSASFGVAGGVGGISSIDHKQPIGNIPLSKPAREFFTKKMKHNEQVLESKWDLWRYTRQGEGTEGAAGSGVGTSADVNTGPETGEEVAAGPSYSYAYSSHPYARAYGPHHSRNHSRDAPSSFTGLPVSRNRTRATSSSSDRGYGYGYGSQSGRQTPTRGLTQAQQKMESKKLDGMLKMHMEAEKDQMKRMAERLKQTQGGATSNVSSER